MSRCLTIRYWTIRDPALVCVIHMFYISVFVCACVDLDQWFGRFLISDIFYVFFWLQLSFFHGQPRRAPIPRTCPSLVPLNWLILEVQPLNIPNADQQVTQPCLIWTTSVQLHLQAFSSIYLVITSNQSQMFMLSLATSIQVMFGFPICSFNTFKLLLFTSQ